MNNRHLQCECLLPAKTDIQPNDQLRGRLIAVLWSTLLGAQYIIFQTIQGGPQFLLATKHQQDRVRNLKHRVVRMEVA